jgi:hypothetical protein
MTENSTLIINNKTMTAEKTILKRIRILIWIFVLGLILSGITAFPLESELKFITDYFPYKETVISGWLDKVYRAVKNTNENYPFLSYGTDWLAFAHLMIAIAFVGPMKNPVRNIWIIEFGMIACISVIPLALVAGEIRQIPLFWRLIDCSFGIIGIIPLYISRILIKKIEKTNSDSFIHSSDSVYLMKYNVQHLPRK